MSEDDDTMRVDLRGREWDRMASADPERWGELVGIIAGIDDRLLDAEAERDVLRAEVEHLRGEVTEARRAQYQVLWKALEAAGITRGDGCPDSILIEEVTKLRAEVERLKRLFVDSDAGWIEPTKVLLGGVEMLTARAERLAAQIVSMGGTPCD
jgi:hypothetical protein